MRLNDYEVFEAWMAEEILEHLSFEGLAKNSLP